MLPVIKTVNAILVRKFYERHAGLLFFVFYFMFGMVESGQIKSYHLGLIYGALSSPLMMLIVFAIWLLYLTKGMLFFDECISRPQNLFFKQVSLLDKRAQFFLFSYAYLIIYQPVLIYSIVMIAVAFSKKAIWMAASMIAFHFLAISLCSLRSVYRINNTKSPRLIIPTLRWPFTLSPPMFYVGLLTSRFKIMLFLTKIASIISLLGFLQIQLDQYEPRLAYLGMIIAILSYSVIIFEWRRFEDSSLQFTRALPINLHQRFLIIAIAYAILLIPEFVVLLAQRFYPWHALIAILLSIGFALFLHTSLYKELNNDHHLRRVLWLFLIAFFFALSKLGLPMAILLVMVSWWQFRKNFMAYEPSANI
ncbi:MAG: hypothetical protein QM734_11390 [Cyclobacteriaceae bacterium]